MKTYPEIWDISSMDSLSGFIDLVFKTTFEMVQDPLGPPRWDRIVPLGDAKSANIVQLFDRFPEARALYPFEAETWWSDCAMSSKWMRELWIAGVPWAIVGSYLLFIVVGQMFLGTSSAVSEIGEDREQHEFPMQKTMVG